MVRREPLGVFLTWRTYGTWLPGDERGWVDERNNSRGERMNRPDARLEGAAKGLMRSAPMEFDLKQREVVDRAIRQTCEYSGWHLYALNVRTNHVHAVLGTDEFPERLLVTLKKQATKALRQQGIVGPMADVWSRGGSHRLLMSEEALDNTVDYVLNRQ